MTMILKVLAYRRACLIVFCVGLFAGVMLQQNWLFLMEGGSFEKSEILRYFLISPLIACLVLGLWIGSLKLISPLFSPQVFEHIVPRDAWSMLALLLTAKVLWAPPLEASTLGWIFIVWIGLKPIAYPKESYAALLVLLQKCSLFLSTIQTWLKSFPQWSVSSRIILMIGIGFFSYTALRAGLIPFTRDESLTFLMGVSQDRLHNSSNNHLLNTILMIAFSSIGGNGEFILRLPNLLAHFLYLLFSFLILRKCEHVFSRFCGFLLLNLNPFMLDFFSLARGYGLALGFTLGSLYFFLNYLQTHHLKNLSWAFGLALFAVLSNLTFLNFYLSLVAVILLREVYQFFYRRDINGSSAYYKIGSGQNKTLLVHLSVLLVICGPYVFNLLKGRHLYYGGETGFWADTVSSLIRVSLYDQTYSFNAFRVIQIIILASLLISFCVWLFHFKKNSQNQPTPLSIVVLLLTFSTLSVILQYHLLGTRFLITRTALLFVPLFSLVFIFSFDYLIVFASEVFKKISSVVLACLTLGFALHSIKAMNVTHSFEWKFDADTKSMISDLIKNYHSLENAKPVFTLGTKQALMKSINFYRITKNLNWLQAVDVEEKNVDLDYYFLFPSNTDLMKKGMIEVKQYPTTNNILARKKNL